MQHKETGNTHLTGVIVTVFAGEDLRKACFPPEGKRPLMMPFNERTVQNGMSYGLSYCGYDVQCAERVVLWPGTFKLCSTVQRFSMPNNMVGIVHDKSTWARRGLAVQ